MRSLYQIMEQYDTDKNRVHSYGDFYEKLLAPIRMHATRILEVGIMKGESLKVWRDYFPYARICGIDVDPKSNDLQFDDDRIITCAMDSTKPESPRFQSNYFDLIIDDGSHEILHQVATYCNLWYSLSIGSIYVCEDIQNITYANMMVRCFGGQVEDLRHIKNRDDDIIWWKTKEN